jgi:hypothetical protein
MLQHLLMATAILVNASSAVIAEELSDEKLQKIAVIDYRGIGFSSSQKDLLKALPEAKPNRHDAGNAYGVLPWINLGLHLCCGTCKALAGEVMGDC